MNETTQNPTQVMKAALFGVFITASFIATPVQYATADPGMQLIANVPAGDGESCPRNPGEKAAAGSSELPPLFVVPMRNISPMKSAVYIEVWAPVTDEEAVEDNVIRFRI